MDKGTLQQIDLLNQIWYLTLVKSLNLSSYNFQLYQAWGASIQSTEWLWNTFNAIPPKSINNYYDPNQGNNFSQNYGGIIAQLAPMTSAFPTCMGDYYSTWNTYLQIQLQRDHSLLQDGDRLKELFAEWSIREASSRQNCSQYIRTFYVDPVSTANILYAIARTSNQAFAYTITQKQVETEIADAPSQSIRTTYDPRTSAVASRAAINNNWTKKCKALPANLFSFQPVLNNSSSQFDTFSKKILQDTISISAHFDHVLIKLAFALNPPLAKDAFANYSPWFYSPALARAYNAKDDTTVWKSGSPTWETSFGENGNTQRRVVGLVIVDGVDILLTSNASFTAEEQTQLIANQQAHNYWPTYRTTTQSSFQQTLHFDEQERMIIHITNPVNNPLVLGVLVEPIGQTLE